MAFNCCLDCEAGPTVCGSADGETHPKGKKKTPAAGAGLAEPRQVEAEVQVAHPSDGLQRGQGSCGFRREGATGRFGGSTRGYLPNSWSARVRRRHP